MESPEIFVKMALDGWQGQLKATDVTLDKLSDDELMNEVSPGRNRGIYLLGHLAAVHDLMMPLLRFGEALYPELQPVFLDAPDKTIALLPPAGQLREQWQAVNAKLKNQFDGLPADEWFTRHANISAEDFVKEPYRNRLNVLLTRTSHLSYHRGQLALLVKKR
jgi:hypothetical protein